MEAGPELAAGGSQTPSRRPGDAAWFDRRRGDGQCQAAGMHPDAKALRQAVHPEASLLPANPAALWQAVRAETSMLPWSQTLRQPVYPRDGMLHACGLRPAQALRQRPMCGRAGHVCNWS